MIPVEERDPPPEFEAKVREPGLRWLAERGLPLAGPVPDGVTLSPFWRECLDDLHREYRGVCAYVSVYIEKVTGSRSVDHFVAKSSAIEAAYEWSNYRLACGKMNSRKRDFSDVLDPFGLEANTFILDLVSLAITPSPALPQVQKDRAMQTIERLGLDDPECRALRAEYFTDYVKGDISAEYLERRCPFVWSEVVRQGAQRA